MSVSRLFYCLSVVALVFAIGAPEVFAQAVGGMRGRVTYEETGEPVAGAAVTAVPPPNSGSSPNETVTGADGRFQMIGMRSGQWETTVSLEGYHDAVVSVRVTQSTPLPVVFYISWIKSALELALGEEALEGLDPVQVEADLVAADAAYNAQDLQVAVDGYNALLTILPQMSDLHLQIGNAHRAMGNFEEALASYETLLAEDADNAEVKNEIARTRLAMGDLDAAEGLTAAAGGLASREDLYNLGELEFAKGNVDAAAGWYEKASAADPGWEKPWFKLGLVALNKGDIEAAKEHFRKVVELAPDSTDGTQAQATLSALP